MTRNHTHPWGSRVNYLLRLDYGVTLQLLEIDLDGLHDDFGHLAPEDTVDALADRLNLTPLAMGYLPARRSLGELHLT